MIRGRGPALFFFFACGNSIVPAYLQKTSVRASLKLSVTLDENELTINERVYF
jgi:hypothetical protein